MRFLVQSTVVAFALWITSLLVAGFEVVPYESGALAAVLTYLLVAAIFGIVNGTIGVILKVLTFPLYILTLGLFGLIINGAMVMLAAWISGLIGFGLVVDGFWTGVWAALILSITSWLIGLVVRPGK